MGRVLGIAALVFVIAAGAYVLGLRQGKRVRLETTTEEVLGRVATTVAAQGRLEPAGGIINIAAIPGDEILAIHVAAGDIVEPGDMLVKFRSHELRRLERDVAAARLEEAKKRIEIEQQIADSKLKAAELSAAEAALQEQELRQLSANLQLLGKRLAQEQRTLERLRGLAEDPVTKDVVAAADVEQQSLLVEKLNSDLEQAQAGLESARKGFDLAVEAADSQLKAAQLSADSVAKASPLGALQAALDLAELNLENSILRVPDIAGDDAKLRVLRVIAKVGERVANMPLLQLGNVAQMTCVAEVYEANLSRVEAGQQAVLRSPALDTPLTGVVVDVGKVIGRPSLPNPNPLSRQDIRTADVTIRLDEASSNRAAELINLQVEVEFELNAESDDVASGNLPCPAPATRGPKAAAPWPARGAGPGGFRPAGNLRRVFS